MGTFAGWARGVPAVAGAALGVLLAAAGVPVPAWAASEGFYLGYGRAQVRIGGDMDGVSYVGGGGSAEVLPDQPTATGNKFIAGFQAASIALELSYTRSKHDGTWGGAPYPTTFNSINLDGKFHLFHGFARPFGLLGFGFTNVKVEGGSSDGFVVRDATFHGVDLRFGGGLDIALSRHFALDLEIVKRWGAYTSVDGVVSGEIQDDVNGDGTTTSLELKYIFAR